VDEIFPVLHPARYLDGITITDPFLELIHGEPLIASPADHDSFLISVSLFMRITGNAGVKEGQDIIINLDDKKANILSLVSVGEKLWNVPFELGNIDNYI
jgi:hypothetical protein